MLKVNTVNVARQDAQLRAPRPSARAASRATTKRRSSPSKPAKRSSWAASTTLSNKTAMPVKKISSDLARASASSTTHGFLGAHRRSRRNDRSSRCARSTRAATTTATSPCATKAAARASSIASSTSSAPRTAFRRRSRRSSTIPTVRAASRCCNYRDGEKRYILAPLGLQGRRAGRVRAEAPTSRSATRCRSRTFRSVRSFTTSSCVPARAASSCARAGVSAQLMAKEDEYSQVRMPSGEVRKIHIDVPRDDRSARQRRAREPSHRQGRPLAPSRQASDACAASR